MQYAPLINNGAQLQLDEAPSINRLKQTNDDAFYTAATEHENYGLDPLEFYLQIQDELETQGYSNVIEATKLKWKEEQDLERRDTIAGVLQDTTISKEDKKGALEAYLYNDTVSDDLKDRYIDNLSFNKLNDKLDVNESDIQKNIEETTELKNEQFLEKLQSITSQSLKNGGSSDYSDNDIINSLIKFDTKSLEQFDKDVLTPVSAELPALFYMLIGAAPAWLVDIWDTYVEEDKVTKGKVIKDKNGDAISKFTDIRAWVQERNSKEAWSYEWQYAIEEMLLDAGWDMETIHNTFVGKSFQKLSEAIHYISTKLTPDDPAKSSMPMEILLALFGAKLAKGTLNAPKNAKDFGQGFKRGLERNKQEKRFRDAKEVIEEPPALLEGPKEIVRTTDKVDAPPVNSPIASTTRTNPELALELIDKALSDTSGQLGKIVNLDPPKLLNLLVNPKGTITQNPPIGWNVDSARLIELEMLKERDAELLVMDPSMPTYEASRGFLTELSHTLNGIETAVPTIISSTFTSTRILPTGIETSLAFRKSTRADYNAREVLAAFSEIKESIEKTSPKEFIESNLENSNLEIHEIDSKGQVVNIIKSESDFAQKWGKNEITNDSFRVIWNKKQEVYEGYLPQEKDFGVTPQEFQTNRLTKWFFDSDTAASVAKDPLLRGTISELTFKYGRLQPGLEQVVYGSRILAQSYLREQQKLVRQAVWKNLNAQNQLHLAKLLDHAAQYELDYFTLGDIRDIVRVNLKDIDVRKIQEAFNVVMSHSRFLYRLANVREAIRLSKDGYTEGAYYTDLNGNQRYMPGKNTFAMKEIKSKTDADYYTNDPAAYWDFETMTPKELVPQKQNYGNTAQVVYEKGMPTHKLYRLAYDYIDPKTQNIYQYGIFGKQKPTPLPTNLFKERKGYTPTIHLDNYVTEAYPLNVTINGHTLDYMPIRDNNGNIIARDLGPSDVIGLDKTKLTSEQISNRREVMRVMNPHKQSIAMREFKTQIDRFNKFSLHEKSPDARRRPHLFLHNTRKVKELEIKGIEDHFRILDSIDMNTVARNKGLNFKLTEDAYASLIETGNATGRAAMEALQLNRLKLAWLRTWKDNNRIQLVKNPEVPESSMRDTSLSRIDKEYPFDNSQIKDVKGMESHGRQARAEWVKIYEQEKGWNTSLSTNTLTDVLNMFGDMTEFNITKRLNRWFRRRQRNPNETREVVGRAVTTFMVLLNFPKQLFLQPIATLGASLVVTRFMPTRTVQGIIDVLGVLSARLIDKYRTDKTMAEALGEVHKYMFEEGGIYEGVGGNAKIFDTRLTYKDYQLINSWGRESGLFQVMDHAFSKGIGSSKIPELGQKIDTSNPLNLLRVNEYPGIVGRAVADVGFNLGEYINRVAGFIVALRNWQAKNPGKNWRHTDALTEIAYQAQQFTGSMTNATRYAWQKIPLVRELWKFESFTHSMSEGMLMRNSLNFTGKERVLYNFTNYALYGTALYGLSQLFMEGAQEIVGEDKDLTWLQKMNGFFQLNTFMDWAVGAKMDKDGNVLYPSESLWGNVFSPTPSEVNLPFWFKLGRMALNAYNNQFNIRDLGATISWMKSVSDGFSLVAQLYGNANYSFTPEEKQRIISRIAGHFVPFIRNPMKTSLGLDLLAQTTKTGGTSGVTPTKGEVIAQGLFGVSSIKQKAVMEALKNKDPRTKLFEEMAKELLYLINTEANSRGGLPRLADAKDMILAYRFVLDEHEYIKGDQYHNEFTDIAIRYLVRNSKPLADQLADSFRQNFQGSRPFYDADEISQARLLAEALTRDDPDSSRWFREQAEMMERTNRRFIGN